MNKIILLTIIFAISHKAAWAQTSGITIRESVGALSMCTDALLSSITTDSGSVELSGPTTIAANKITTSGSGTGLAVKITGAGSTTAGLTGITVTTAGSGYQIGDTVTIEASVLVTSSDVVITLQEDDFAHGELLQAADTLADGSLGTNSGGVELNSNTGAGLSATLVLSFNADAAHHGVTLTVNGDGSSSGLTTVTVNSCTRGFKVGDTITIDEGVLVGGTDVVLTIQADDLVSGISRTRSSYLTSLGAPLSFAQGTNTGYYLSLRKSTRQISVATTNAAATSLVPQMNGVTDTTVTTKRVSRLFEVKAGMNILDVVTDDDGTYTINMVKPDDEIKVITKGKRSMEIAYNPASVGEFTCAAYADSSTDPASRAEVKTASGVITKSVMTHNILPENTFKSVQMTLNRLTPDTEYEIHCFHLSHGIISHNADGSANTKTDKASLTGVSLVPSAKAAGAYTTLTLTFTHEKSLAAGATIALKLYNDYDTPQTLTAGTTSQCGSQITTITSAGVAITGSHTCDDSSNELTITLVTGGSTVTSTGTEVIIVLTSEDTNLHLPDNAAAGTVTTFDLEVTGHGKLQQQDGWVTE